MNKETKDKTGSNEHLLAHLNQKQIAAVKHDKGPLLILAGAGSGKTRVITHRVVWLIQELGVHPSAILAITFTNKAAAEMKQRIGDLIGPTSQAMWIGTFHSMLARILRRFADRIGYNRNFTILDTGEQLQMVKECVRSLNLDEKMFAFRNVHSQISSAKNALIDYRLFKQRAGDNFYQKRVADIFECYQETMKRNNCLDFDDILFEAVRLFEEHKDVLKEYQSRFQYILVDEYQDTNQAQYQIIHLLAQKHRNLCVVGDDDQSIYAFRGANIRNILDFEKDFKSCRVIKLEQNYRSSGYILKAANSVISYNDGRKAKELWTEKDNGELITLFHGDNQYEEGIFIANEIERQVLLLKKKKYSDFAILYRLNALSRSAEQSLREQGIPYRIYGGTRFYDRKEIKDILAYLRLVLIPEDDLALARIINTPRRGIGQVTMDALRFIAQREGLTLTEVCARALEFKELQRSAPRLMGFAHLIAEMRQGLDNSEQSFAEYIDWVEKKSGIIQDLVSEKGRHDNENIIDRLENLKELLSDALEFERQIKEDWQLPAPDMRMPEDELPETFNLAGLLSLFLERTALFTELDHDQSGDDVVRLMTIHSAKGLEFDTVFVLGMEEGLFPGYRSLGKKEDLEEERRLAYVAITRAERKLYLTTVGTRLIFGQSQRFPLSTFAKEIPEEYIERIGDDQAMGITGGQRQQQLSSFLNGERDKAWPWQKEKTKVADKKPAQSEQVLKLKAGDQVRHPVFGPGQIVSADPVAGDLILVVEFESVGKKRMLARLSRLVRQS